VCLLEDRDSSNVVEVLAEFSDSESCPVVVRSVLYFTMVFCLAESNVVIASELKFLRLLTVLSWSGQCFSMVWRDGH